MRENESLTIGTVLSVVVGMTMLTVLFAPSEREQLAIAFISFTTPLAATLAGALVANRRSGKRRTRSTDVDAA